MLLARSYCHHSLLSAVPKTPDLIKNAKAKGYTSLALTDEETGSALIEFYEECLKQDMKPVLGVTLKTPNLSGGEAGFGRNRAFSKIAILAKNYGGYQALLELVTTARTVREEPTYHLLLEDLQAQYALGREFFVLLGGNDHEVISNLKNDKPTNTEKVLQKYVDAFGAQNVLCELAVPLDTEDKNFVQKVNQQLVALCQKLGVTVLPSPAPRYLEKDDNETFRVVLAIRDQKRLGEITLTRDLSLPSVEELKQQYAYLPPDIFDTTKLEEQINLTIRTDYDKHAEEAFFPLFELPPGHTAGGALIWESYIGLVNRFGPQKHEQDTSPQSEKLIGAQRKDYWKTIFPYDKQDELKAYVHDLKPGENNLAGYAEEYWQSKTIQDYIDRTERELGVIIQKGYPAYFLVLADIMQFCRRNDIVTNTRGSAAGCLVGYLTDINILDPLVYALPFERFLNPLRPSAPDIDGDFADDKRELVIQYITQKYGAENVCQIITFGTMLPRAAVRDVGRALGVSYKKCDRLSKLIPTAPQGKKTNFKWALETSTELAEVYEKDEEAHRIIEIAKKIEANYRHHSVHAAGVVISPTKMSDFAPMQWDSDHKMIICQYDMKIVEKVGLVKMDILGIRNLAILGNAIKLTEERRKLKVDLLNIDLQDKKAFDLLSKGRTIGLFQLGGNTMTRYLVELEPEKVQDLMAMVALYRPGPMANIPDYIKRKKNPRLIKYYVPEMEKWMKESYGILVYQDDLLYTVIELAGYDWAEADTFRKGVGKKIQAVLDSQHTRFVEGCIKNGISEQKAEEIWEVMVPFAAYGFNKAHASNYGMVAYWTAYMKAEYTVEFMTGLMTAESNNLDKIAAIIKECYEMGLQVLPPHINKSFEDFTIEDDRTIRYGMGSIKNLGSDVIKFIIEDRKQSPYESLTDFLDRMSQFRGFNKRSLEALVWSGCLDDLGRKCLA